MLDEILKKLGLGDGSLNADISTRRKYIRYAARQAETMIGDRVFRLQDWSLGGVSFDTPPDARLLVGDRLNLRLLFHFPHDTIMVDQAVHVVRTGRRTAVAFTPGAGPARRALQRVLDSHNAQDFLQSQSVA